MVPQATLPHLAFPSGVFAFGVWLCGGHGNRNTASARAWSVPAFLVALVATAVYLPSLFAGLVADDWLFVAGAKDARGVGVFFSFQSFWFVRPVQWLVTYGLWHIAQTAVLPYHLASLLFHGINCILLTALIRPLIWETRGESEGIAVALWTAAIFAFQSTHYEAIGWYAAINEPIRFTFVLCCLLSLARLVGVTATRDAAVTASLGLLAAILALLCKESSVVLPLEAACIAVAATAKHQRPNLFQMQWMASLLTAVALVTMSWVVLYVSWLGTGGQFWEATVHVNEMHASAWEWVLRAVQFFNGHFEFAGAVNRRTWLLVGEAIALPVFIGVAAMAGRRVVVLGTVWSFVNSVPYLLAVPEFSGSILDVPFSEARFGYCSSAGAILAVVAAAAWLYEAASERRGPRRGPMFRRSLAGFLLVLGAAWIMLRIGGVRAEEQEWAEAGSMAAGIVSDIRRLVPEPQMDATLCVGGVPDNRHGTVVFRNGFSEAVHLAYGRDDFRVAGIKWHATAFDSHPRLRALHCRWVLDYDRSSGTVSPLRLSDREE